MGRLPGPVCETEGSGVGVNTGPVYTSGSMETSPGGAGSSLVYPPAPPPIKLTTKRVGDGELLLAGVDGQGALLRPWALLPLGSPLLNHALQPLQPLLGARDELGLPDLQGFLTGARKTR